MVPTAAYYSGGSWQLCLYYTTLLLHPSYWNSGEHQSLPQPIVFALHPENIELIARGISQSLELEDYRAAIFNYEKSSQRRGVNSLLKGTDMRESGILETVTLVSNHFPLSGSTESMSIPLHFPRFYSYTLIIPTPLKLPLF